MPIQEKQDRQDADYFNRLVCDQRRDPDDDDDSDDDADFGDPVGDSGWQDDGGRFDE